MSRRISLLALVTLFSGLLVAAAASEPAKTSSVLAKDPAAGATRVVATAAASPAAASGSRAPATTPSWLPPAPAATRSLLEPPAQTPVPLSMCSNLCYSAWIQCRAGCNGDTSCLQGCTNDYDCCVSACSGNYCP